MFMPTTSPPFHFYFRHKCGHFSQVLEEYEPDGEDAYKIPYRGEAETDCENCQAKSRADRPLSAKDYEPEEPESTERQRQLWKVKLERVSTRIANTETARRLRCRWWGPARSDISSPVRCPGSKVITSSSSFTGPLSPLSKIPAETPKDLSSEERCLCYAVISEDPTDSFDRTVVTLRLEPVSDFPSSGNPHHDAMTL